MPISTNLYLDTRNSSKSIDEYPIKLTINTSVNFMFRSRKAD